MEPLRVGVIGRTGRGDYGHALDVVWQQVPGVTLVAVADDDADGLASAARRLGVDRAYPDYRVMLEREQLDIVTVAPHWLDGRRDMILASAAAGCHMLIEKPLAINLKDADEIVAACERANLKLAIAHHTRYSPRTSRVLELIDQGRIGEIVEIRGRGKEDARAGCEDFMLLGSHILDLFRLILGDAHWCLARLAEHGRRVTAKDIREGGYRIGPVAGDRVDAMFGFESAAVAHFSTQRHSAESGWRLGLQIFGTRGVIDMTTGSLPDVRLLEDPLWGRTRTDWRQVTSAGVDEPEPLQDEGLQMASVWMATDLVDSIREDRQPKCNLYDARATLEMIMGAYESHRLGAEVQFPLANRRHPLEQLAS